MDAVPDAGFFALRRRQPVGYGAVDTNLFGAGRTLSLFFAKDADRDSKGLFYGNPNVADRASSSRRWSKTTATAIGWCSNVGQPFYSDSMPDGLSESRFEDTDEEQGLYQFGDKFAEFRDKTSGRCRPQWRVL